MSWSGLPDRIERKIIPEPNSGCWLWIAATDRKGYGWVRYKTLGAGAHRHVYTILRGPIPEGLTLDHLCRLRCCVNPDHLEPVTGTENTSRGLSGQYGKLKTHCPSGHLYSPENTSRSMNGKHWVRYCKMCKRVKRRQRRAAGHS
jgi:hypothetical protein